MDISKANYPELDAYLVQWSKSNNAPLHTVASLLTKWDTFVGRLAVPYRLTIDDYTNALGPRQILQVLFTKFSKETAPLQEEIETADRKFVRLTKPSKKMRQYFHNLDPAWLERIPSQVTDDFW
jgi:hypothetical protein